MLDVSGLCFFLSWWKVVLNYVNQTWVTMSLKTLLLDLALCPKRHKSSGGGKKEPNKILKQHVDSRLAPSSLAHVASLKCFEYFLRVHWMLRWKMFDKIKKTRNVQPWLLLHSMRYKRTNESKGSQTAAHRCSWFYTMCCSTICWLTPVWYMTAWEEMCCTEICSFVWRLIQSDVQMLTQD